MLRASPMGIWWSTAISWHPKTCAWERTFCPERDRLRTWNVLKSRARNVLKSRARKEMLIVKMSKRTKRSLPYLQILAKSKPKLRKILIENVPESVITTIYECCLNTLKGVIALTPRQKRRLAPYKTHLRALVNRKVSRKCKKTYLMQRRKPVNSSFTTRSGRAWKFVLDMRDDVPDDEKQE